VCLLTAGARDRPGGKIARISRTTAEILAEGATPGALERAMT